MAYDFTEISAQGLSVLAAERQRRQVPSGMTPRFVARARSDGIEMRRETVSKGRKPSRATVFAGVGAVAAAALIVGSLMLGRPKPFRSAGEQSTAPPTAVAALGTNSQPALVPDARLQKQLALARAELSALDVRIRAQYSELESASNAKDTLNSRVADVERENTGLLSDRVHLEARMNQLQEEFEKSRSEKNAGDVAMALQETEIRDLRKQVADQTEALEQQEQLAARESDVRDLVVARNLHIIDVHDRDGDGQSQRAFGRIFYTEGKSLIFYAYDLADPRKVDAKVSFYVWGEHLGAEKPVRSLGIFHNDDSNDGRWLLTFDDPKVLAQINSVFVTVESTKKVVKEPSGPRVLFAFLGDSPNHP
jgi:hypothetical protein